MSKPFAILQPNEKIEGLGIYNPDTREIAINVRRNDGSLTEEIGKLGQHIVSLESAGDCALTVGAASELPDPDAIAINVTTTGGIWQKRK
jgi:hypothetical protein